MEKDAKDLIGSSFVDKDYLSFKDWKIRKDAREAKMRKQMTFRILMKFARNYCPHITTLQIDNELKDYNKIQREGNKCEFHMITKIQNKFNELDENVFLFIDDNFAEEEVVTFNIMQKKLSFIMKDESMDSNTPIILPTEEHIRLTRIYNRINNSKEMLFEYTERGGACLQRIASRGWLTVLEKNKWEGQGYWK